MPGIDELTRDHLPFLRGLATKLCRSHFDRDDLVQDVLERMLRHFDRLPVGVNHRAWMAKVMQNRHVDGMRRRTAASAGDAIDDLPMPAADRDTRAWWLELDAQEVRARLAELPDELRIPIELFALAGCSYEEIAARLGVPRCTVGTRILRARRRLKELCLGG
jgi:RNA polymerase sigma-70 factor (ECF subfamily)